MKINFFLLGIICIVVLAGTFLVKGGTSTTEEIVNAGNAQTARLYVDGINYALEPSEFKVGVPVRMEADMSKMPGCSRSIVIPAFGVRKTFTSSNNVVEFTPTKKGTFNIACSMNMYRGTFKVVD